MSQLALQTTELPDRPIPRRPPLRNAAPAPHDSTHAITTPRLILRRCLEVSIAEHQAPSDRAIPTSATATRIEPTHGR
jgi:hypothetical protein